MTQSASTKPDQGEGLRAALAEYDAVSAACPANKQFLGEKLCPKCGAGPSEGCREDARAAYRFIQSVRTIIGETGA